MELVVLGSKGLAPTRHKRVKKYTQALILDGKTKILIDAGNKVDFYPDLVLITHLHKDHIGKFDSLPRRTKVGIPHRSFLWKLRKLNPLVDFYLLEPKRINKFKGFKIMPFEVPHSRTTRTFGYRIEKGNLKLVWLPDFRRFKGALKFLKRLDYLFIGTSALKRDILHKNHDIHGQQSIMNSLETLKEKQIRPKKIYLIHFGQGLAPLKVKVKYIQKQFPMFDIEETFDGKRIKLKDL